ncbi:MAG TPA: hypothetical protein VGS12_15460 [Caulobacteraceae bacterium]|nr:hypothetical protein [Caulobacteraceae bacterium]
MVGLSGLAASVIAGQLWDRVGASAVFFWGAALSVAGAAALAVLVPVKREARAR